MLYIFAPVFDKTEGYIGIIGNGRMNTNDESTVFITLKYIVYNTRWRKNALSIMLWLHRLIEPALSLKRGKLTPLNKTVGYNLAKPLLEFRMG